MVHQSNSRYQGGSWLVFAALLILTTGPSAWADVGPPVKIRMPGDSRMAVSGEEYVGTFLVQVGKPGALAGFEFVGEGWTLVDLDDPGEVTVGQAGVVRIPFRAIPGDADASVGLSLTFDGRRITKTFKIGPTKFAQRGKDHAGVRVFTEEVSLADPEPPEGEEAGEPMPRCDCFPLHLSGRVVYTRTAGTDMNGNSVPAIDVGVDNIWVEIMDDDGLASDTLVDEAIISVFTDENGYFDTGPFCWDDCDIAGDDVPDLYFRWEADTFIVDVQDGDDITEPDWSWDTTSEIHANFTGTRLDFGTWKPADISQMPALHIHNSIVRAHRFIREQVNIDVPRVDVLWPDGDTGAFYDSEEPEIHIGIDRQWREDTHTHEYGHHFLQIFSATTDPDYCNDFCDGDGGGCTSGTDCESEGHCLWCPETAHDAWNEGWPNWLADVVTRSYPGRYQDDNGQPYVPLNTRNGENIGLCCQDQLSYNALITEGYVMALLRDMEDGFDLAGNGLQDDHNADGIQDQMCSGLPQIFDVVTTLKPTTPALFISSFLFMFPERMNAMWQTAMNVAPEYVAGFFPPDTQPPGIVTVLDSLTHPFGIGGTAPCITVNWDPPPDDVSGACAYSYVWGTDPAGAAPNTVANSVVFTGCRPSTTVPNRYFGEYYISIRAQDCVGNWSPNWKVHGPFVVNECNDNGIIDICEISCTPSVDRFGCTLSPTYCNPFLDCGMGEDCNGNFIPDDCDIASGFSEDCELSEVPDECEPVKHWDGGDASWHAAGSWVEGVTPQLGDHVCVADEPGSVTLAYSSQTTELEFLACNESLRIAGGVFPWANVTINAPSWVTGDLTISGVNTVVTVNDKLDILGQLIWSGPAKLTGTGMTEVSGGMQIPSSVVTLRTHVLTLGGSSSAVSNGRLDFSGGSTFHILSGATYDHQSSFSVFSGFTSDLFDNDGTLIKSVNTGSSSIGVFTDNSGEIRVKKGTLTMTRGSTSTGSFVGEPGTLLAFRGGGHELLPGSSIVADQVLFESGIAGVNNIRGTYDVTTSTTQTGQPLTFTDEATIISYGGSFFIPRGTVNFDAIVAGPIVFDTLVLGTPISASGTANFNSGDPVEVTTLTIGPGSINGPTDITVSGLLTWKASGHFTGPGEVNANGGLLLDPGGGQRTFNNRTLNNAANATFQGGFSASGGFQINNLATGVMDIQVDGTIMGGTNGALHNAGLFQKTQGGGTSFIDPDTTNTGTVEVLIGVLAFDETYVQTAGATILNGGDLAMTDLPNPQPVEIQGGVLRGTGTVTGLVSNTGGTVEPGLPVGEIVVDGFVQSTGGTLEIELGGLDPGVSFDVVTVTGNAVLGGTLKGSLIPPFELQDGDSFEILTALALIGTFDPVEFAGLPIGTTVEVIYSPSSVVMTANVLAFPGDCDGNMLVNLDDYACFEVCMAGPGGGGLSPGCEAVDFDNDGDVDLEDMTIMQLLLGV